MVFDLNDLILCCNCILFRQTIRRHLAEKVARRNRSAYRLTVLTSWLISRHEVKCILSFSRGRSLILFPTIRIRILLESRAFNLRIPELKLTGISEIFRNICLLCLKNS